MLPLGMAPPVPLEWKLVAAFMMLGLVGLLLHAGGRSRITVRSIGLAVATCIGVLGALECILLAAYGGGPHDRGLVAAIVGALSGGLFLRSRAARPEAKSSRLILPVIALFVGPAIGIVLASLCIWLGDVDRIDRGYTFAVLGQIGTPAGVIGAIVLGIIGWTTGRTHDAGSTPER